MGPSKGEGLVSVIDNHNDTIAWVQWTFPAVYLDCERLLEALPIARFAEGELACFPH